MTITLQDALDFVGQVLHDDPDPSTPPITMVNEAGILATTAYSWTWLRRAQKTIGAIAGQSWLEIGDDVEEVLSLVPVATSFGRAIPCSLHEITVMREAGYPIGGNLVTYWAASWGTSTTDESTGGEIQKRIEVFDTPSTSIAEAFRLLYRAKWATLTNDNPAGTKLTLPDFMEPLYKRVLRCVAKGYEEDAIYDMDQELSRIFEGAIAQAAVRADAAQVATLGRISNGSVQSAPSMPSEADTIYVNGLLDNATLL